MCLISQILDFCSVWEFFLSSPFFGKRIILNLMGKTVRKIVWNSQCLETRKEGFVFRGIQWLWNQCDIIWEWYSPWLLNILKSLLLLHISPRAQWELQGSCSSRIQSIFTYILWCWYFSIAAIWTINVKIKDLVSISMSFDVIWNPDFPFVNSFVNKIVL